MSCELMLLAITIGSAAMAVYFAVRTMRDSREITQRLQRVVELQRMVEAERIRVAAQRREVGLPGEP
jgi:type II secretory pathway component PulJ